MSSSAGMQPSEISILARWMPSRHRAGVILSPSLDGAGSPRDSWDDSFASQFVPLPASNSSSSISLDSLVLADTRDPDQKGKMKLLDTLGIAEDRVCLDVADRKTSDCPIAQKLEELKELQRAMQEQLKAHQMEQLHPLLPEPQRFLGTVGQHSSTDFAGSSLLAGKGPVTAEPSQWALLAGSIGISTPSQAISSPPAVRPGLPLLPVQSLQWEPNAVPGRASLGVVGQQESPHSQQDPKTSLYSEKGEAPSDTTLGADVWEQSYSRDQHSADRSYRNAKSDNDDRELTTSTSNDQLPSPGREDDWSVPPSEDRPIKPGVGSKKQTFEELLEEQLQLEEQRMKVVQLGQTTVEVKGPLKRTFLRRGEGLARFTRGKAAIPKRRDKDAVTHVPPKSSTSSDTGPSRNIQKNSVSQRPAIQRKTTALNKENRPEHQPVGQELRRPQTKGAVQPQTRVLGRNQRQNIVAPDLGRSKAGETQEHNGKETTSSGMQGRRLVPLSRPPPSKAVLVTKYMSGEEMSGVQRQMQMRPTPRASQPPPESFELSFQGKLERWDSEKLQENAELGEFELLEQAAEELSFSSNSSFVMKVLQLDRQSRGGHHNRRLSSTPIKSLERSQSAGTGCRPPVCTGAVRLKPGTTGQTKSDNLKVKEVQALTNTDATRASSHSSLELGDPDDTVREVVSPAEPALHGHLSFPVPSGALYDRMSYQDRDTDLDHNKGKESCEVEFNQHAGAILTENGEARTVGHIVFDDGDTWNDVEEAGDLEEEEETAGDDDDDDDNETRMGDSDCVSIGAISHVPSAGALKRKVAAVKGEERGLYPKEGDQVSSPPPTSQLVAKLFPSVKPKVKPGPAAAVEPPTAVAEQVAGPNPLSRQLRERLVELEIEIERFKEENAKLAHLKQQREAGLEALRKDVVAFEQRKAKELADLEEMKKEEARKLQRERRVFERHASAARAVPDKKEREEIQALKQQLSSLQDELRRREARWSNTHSRLRKQLETLSAENAALRDEVQVLEKLRVATWKKAEAEKEKCTVQANDISQTSSRRSKSDSSTRTTCDTTLLPSSTWGSVQGHNPLATGKPSVHWAEGNRASDLCRGTVVENSVSPDCLPRNSGALVKEPCGDENEEDRRQDEVESQETITHPDGKIEHVLRWGGRLILFPNGTRKEVSADGQTVKITFFNGDVKQVTDDQQVIYYYAEAQTTHTTYPDGMEVLRFPNNQIEKHFPDGRKEITFPDQTVKNLFPDGKEESIFPDGTVIEAEPDGSKVIRFNNGQREVHTATFKRREYPDGTAKTIHADGRQETRYPTGRLRVKDKDGHIVMDTMT
ncbi:centrosomal P4.1-associated protein [Paramormyrops kingsleyae]|uniref:centrosomal P4.1-associated protein n=1 Tax=Paramormyrops kingsleyae TaxID=1676925 RepID=UPI003B96E7AA